MQHCSQSCAVEGTFKMSPEGLCSCKKQHFIPVSVNPAHQLGAQPKPLLVQQQVFCLEHRTYTAHSCTAAEGRNSTIIVCPLCAKAVKLPPGSDVHAVFEAHTREGACDPTNYDKVHKRPKCPAAGCKEKLSFSNTYECKTCLLRVCLKHRHGDDHGCAAVQGEAILLQKQK